MVRVRRTSDVEGAKGEAPAKARWSRVNRLIRAAVIAICGGWCFAFGLVGTAIYVGGYYNGYPLGLWALSGVAIPLLFLATFWCWRRFRIMVREARASEREAR